MSRVVFLPGSVFDENYPSKWVNFARSATQQIIFAFGKDIDGTPLNPMTFPWPQLNNQEVTLSFRPATQADQDALVALLPAGNVTDLSQLPTAIPAYLIHVVPELKVNGIVVMSGDPMSLGTDFDFVFDPIFVSSGEQDFDYTLPAGSYEAIAVVAGSVSPTQLIASRTQLDATKTILTENDPAQFSNLTRDRLLGDTYHAAMLAYYAQYLNLSHAAGLEQGGHNILAAGVGSFGYEPNVDTFFGIPRSIKSGGSAANVPIVNVIEYDGNDAGRSADFTTQLGALSSILEYVIPQQLTASVLSGNEAISAAKALQMANKSGQKIFEITQSNESSTLSQIHHDPATMAEISNAIAAGKIVITHTDSVSIPGWTGSGYVILDPETGAGAWKIAGGSNGGYLSIALGGFLFLTIFTTFGFSALFILAIALISIATNMIILLDELDCQATAPLLISLAISAILLRFPVQEGTPTAFLSWMIGFISDGETGTSAAACRRVVGE